MGAVATLLRGDGQTPNRGRPVLRTLLQDVLVLKAPEPKGESSSNNTRSTVMLTSRMPCSSPMRSGAAVKRSTTVAKH